MRGLSSRLALGRRGLPASRHPLEPQFQKGSFLGVSSRSTVSRGHSPAVPMSAACPPDPHPPPRMSLPEGCEALSTHRRCAQTHGCFQRACLVSQLSWLVALSHLALGAGTGTGTGRPVALTLHLSLPWFRVLLLPPGTRCRLHTKNPAGPSNGSVRGFPLGNSQVNCGPSLFLCTLPGGGRGPSELLVSSFDWFSCCLVHLLC